VLLHPEPVGLQTPPQEPGLKKVQDGTVRPRVLAALRAGELAQSTDSELHVVHVGVVPSFLKSDPGTLGYDGWLYEQLEEESRELLRKLSWRVKAAGSTVAGTHLRIGAVDLEIMALAKELGTDLIVMGCRGNRG
jgi:nucleotide-binding universal stress UspA family protein